MARRSLCANENYSRSRCIALALTYHCGIAGAMTRGIAGRERRNDLMHTPEGFTPSHARPDDAAGRHARVRLSRRQDSGRRAGRRARRAATRRRSKTSGSTATRHYLGELAGVACVAVPLPADAPEPAGWRYAGLRSLFFRLPEPLLAIAARAFQVVEWDRTHRYCGRCGTPTRNKEGERAKECPACGYVAYPRVTPAMMVLDHARPRAAPRARAALSARDVQRARGLRRAGRDDRGLHPARSARGSGTRGRRHPLLREPVVGVPALADDRVHGRIRRRRAPARRDRNRRSAVVPVGRGAESAAVASRSRAG